MLFRHEFKNSFFTICKIIIVNKRRIEIHDDEMIYEMIYEIICEIVYEIVCEIVRRFSK